MNQMIYLFFNRNKFKENKKRVINDVISHTFLVIQRLNDMSDC